MAEPVTPSFPRARGLDRAPRRRRLRRTSSGGRIGLLPRSSTQDRPECGHLRRRAAQHGVGRAVHRRQGPAVALPVGRGAAQSRPVGAREPRHPHDRAVRRHQRQHRLSSGGRLQEPGHRHPERQLRRRLLRPRDEVRRLRRDHHRGRVACAGRRHHQGRRRRLRPGRAQVLGPQDLGDRAGPARRLRSRTPRRCPSARPASRSSCGPASRPTSTTRPGGAVTAPSGATRSSRPSPSAAPAR